MIGFKSRYCARSVVLPNYATDAEAFATGVIEFVREHPTRVVIPGSDGAIAALMPVREQLAALGSTLALAAEAELKIANDKDLTLEIARGLGIDYPKSMVIERRIDQLPELLAGFDFPIVLKPTTSWAPNSTVRLQAVEVIDEAEARTAIDRFLDAGVHVVAQQWVGGEREAFMMFVVDGEVHASIAQVAHRTTPRSAVPRFIRECTADSTGDLRVIGEPGQGHRPRWPVRGRVPAGPQQSPVPDGDQRQARRDDRERRAGRGRFPAPAVAVGDRSAGRPDRQLPDRRQVAVASR